jgi:hypothetical protein
MLLASPTSEWIEVCVCGTEPKLTASQFIVLDTTVCALAVLAGAIGGVMDDGVSTRVAAGVTIGGVAVLSALCGAQSMLILNDSGSSSCRAGLAVAAVAADWAR